MTNSDAFVKGMVIYMEEREVMNAAVQAPDTDEKTHNISDEKKQDKKQDKKRRKEMKKEMKEERKKERKERKKEGKEKKKQPWISRGILVSAVFALILSSMYDVIRKRAEEYAGSPLETYDNIAWLYQCSYLLYKDLYNLQAEEPVDYREMYLQPKEGYEWILDFDTDHWDDDNKMAAELEQADELQTEYIYSLNSGIVAYDELFEALERGYSYVNNNFDYVIRDNVSGKFLTNMSEEELSRSLDSQAFCVSFDFSETGIATVGENIAGTDAVYVRRLANDVARTNSLRSMLGQTSSEAISRYSDIKAPADCTVTFCVSQKELEQMRKGYFSDQISIPNGTTYYYSDHGVVSASYYYMNGSFYESYNVAHASDLLISFFALTALFGLCLPVMKGSKPWREVKVCSLPLEALLCIGTVIIAGFAGVAYELVVHVASGSVEDNLYRYMLDSDLAQLSTRLINFIGLTAFFFCGWYLGVCARAVFDLGIKEYIKQRSIVYRIFPFVKSKALAFYDSIVHFDVTKDAHKTILKVVLINALNCFFISSIWFAGYIVAAVYSVILYVVLRKYISDLQKKYGLLLHATNEIAEGNLNVAITEDMGVFEPLKPQIIRIQRGFKNAVEEETKSQRMKAELITNVSHDLKTPLTAIITYINLLKEDSVTEEQRREYLDTLERKSLRLKVLIEDLFEVSKANSQTITLSIVDVDIMNLVKQVVFEMTDKLEAANLDVRINLTDEKIILPLDSQKTYRIYENLLGNIAKYALSGTRVYINGFRTDDTVIITMKNISAQEITVDASELTERFVRGDESRNTEGSGLGLAIAKSFMELQGGELSLEVDGDLFKVTTCWHV